jgi:hypothetical protein
VSGDKHGANTEAARPRLRRKSPSAGQIQRQALRDCPQLRPLGRDLDLQKGDLIERILHIGKRLLALKRCGPRRACLLASPFAGVSLARQERGTGVRPRSVLRSAVSGDKMSQKQARGAPPQDEGAASEMTERFRKLAAEFLR